jgi:hypothetical protein
MSNEEMGDKYKTITGLILDRKKKKEEDESDDPLPHWMMTSLLTKLTSIQNQAFFLSFLIMSCEVETEISISILVISP